MADIKELDGKIMAMAVNPDLGCCAKAMWSWCAHCKSNSYILEYVQFMLRPNANHQSCARSPSLHALAATRAAPR